MADVIAAIATGRAAGAIGILRLSGDGCIETANKVFTLQSGKSLTELQDRTLHLGTLFDLQGRVIDQAMAFCAHGPHSYTGEDTVELHCHGSPAALAAGLEALLHAGARQARPGEFTQRAFLGGKMDLIAAEAVADLIDAETADAAANAAGQLAGAIRQRIAPVYQSLTEICSHYHAVLDYPDEDIPDFQLTDFSQQLAQAGEQLNRLLSTAERGRILKNGVRVALIGRPNAGKSSLLNALAGYERAIVTAVAGTTRDTVEETIRLGQVPARIIDTAGIRQTADEIEALGVERSRQAAEGADLAMFICDGSQPLTQEDDEAMAAARLAPRSIAVVNKLDLPRRVFRLQLSFDPIFFVSAKTGEGLAAIGEYVSQCFAADLPCDGGILTNTRQADALTRAKEALDRAAEAIDQGVTPDAVLTEIELALECLGELTGATVREDITQDIFRRFCVGK